MLKNVINYLKEAEVEYEIQEDDEAIGVQFNFRYVDVDVDLACGFIQNKEQEITNFYTEIAEFDKDTRGEAILVCQLLNYDTVSLKFYLNDDNVLIGECFIFDKDVCVDQIEQILGDLQAIQDTIEPYVISE